MSTSSVAAIQLTRTRALVPGGAVRPGFPAIRSLGFRPSTCTVKRVCFIMLVFLLFIMLFSGPRGWKTVSSSCADSSACGCALEEDTLAQRSLPAHLRLSFFSSLHSSLMQGYVTRHP